MDKATYRYYLDFWGDGSFGGALDDITEYVLTAYWDRGNDSAEPGQTKAGTLRLKLDNSTSIFSPGYELSPLSPAASEILPGRAVKVTMEIDPGVEVTEWAGYLESIDPVVGEVVDVSTAELLAYGFLAQYTDGQIDIAMLENCKTGEAVSSVFASMAGSEIIRAYVDEGQSTLSRFWAHRGSPLQVLRELEAAEFGQLGEAKDGLPTFRDRAYPFTWPNNQVKAWYGEDSDLHLWNLKLLNALPGIYNVIETKVRTFNKSDEVVLATVVDVEQGLGGAPIPISSESPAGPLIIWVDVPNPDSSSDYLAVDTWGIVDYEVNSAEDGSGTDLTEQVAAERTEFGNRIKLEFTNNSGTKGYFVLLRVNGIAIVEGDSIPIRSEDAESQEKYRKRLYPAPSQWITDIEHGRDYCDYIISYFKDPRTRLQFELRANYDAVHLAESQRIDIGDCIHIKATDPYGLFVDSYFRVDHLAHTIDSGCLHTVQITCSTYPQNPLSADSKPYTPNIVKDLGPPDDLYVNAFDPGQRVVFGVQAWKYNSSIVKAQFRAKLVTGGNAPIIVDLRTVEEGGTLSDDSPYTSTQIIADDLTASQDGCQFWYKSESVGRWYYAWRLKNSKGWSVWSDGNVTPKCVRDYVEVDSTIDTDDGPPALSTGSLAAGSMDNSVVASVRRPPEHGSIILDWAVQLHDTSQGEWVDLDSDVEPASTYYDGSGEDHVYDKANATIRRQPGTNPILFGGVQPGDLILLDVRNAGGSGGPTDQFHVDHCQWGIVSSMSSDAVNGDVLYNCIGFRPNPDYDSGSIVAPVWEHIRIKIVRPPWEWQTGGFFGAEFNHGLWNEEYWTESQNGDRKTEIFVSDPILYPETVNIEDLEARVWFENKYSRAPVIIDLVSFEQGYCIPVDLVEDTDVSPSAWYLRLDASLVNGTGKIFTCTVGHDFILEIQNGVCGLPVPMLIRQDAIGGREMTLGDMCKLGVTISDATLSTDPDYVDYLGFLYYDSAYCLVAFVTGYDYATSPSSPASPESPS